MNGTYYNYSFTWADLLTSYDVVASGITSTTSYTYDNGGNPTAITNFKYKGTVYDEALLTWDGRSLKTITVRDNNTTIATITYTYNDQGIRIKKVIVEGVVETVTDYYLSGNQVVLEKTNDCVILYTYDVDGSLISFNYLDQEYFYVKDILGNIVRIIDATGTTLVEYQYDAYGNILHIIDTSGTLGLSTINPYTYRGYRYDAEISYYYCNTRYYQPIIGRWLNADHVSFLDPEGVSGLNLFGYCYNNPIMYSDLTGHAPKWLIIVGITALAIAAITITIISCGAAAAGAGALATMAAYVTGIGTIATTVGAIATGATYAISCLVVAGISAFAMADIQSVVTNGDNNYLGFLGNSYDTIKSSLYGIAFLLPFVGQYAPIQGESFYGNGKASEHGVPYSTYTQITPNGNNTAYYDAYGNQIYRIDTSHFHNGWKPHIHIFDWYMYDNVWRYVKDVIPY